MSDSQVKPLALKIGPYELHAIPTGLFALDGGAMFGTVPKVLWEKSNPADEKNRISMEARALLLKSAAGNILIDTGNGGDFVPKYGDKLGSKFSEIFGMQTTGDNLEKSLKKQGLEFDDIDHVILTHLHFDHAGGGTYFDGSTIVPRFKNAKYWIQAQNLETARNANSREKASYYPANFEPLIQAGVVNILDGETHNFLPNISALISHGHTQGQQIIQISDDTTGILYCADLVPTSTHTKLPWIMGYDLQPLVLIEEKAKYLGQAADQKWYLFFEHDPYCDSATIIRQGKDFAVEQKYWLE